MKHSHAGTPYLEVVDEPRMMAGKGAPRSTVFGVLGRTKETGKMRTLGGLVQKRPSEAIPKDAVMKSVGVKTDRDIAGPASKTHVPGAHFGQIPYPGLFMAQLGHRL